MLAPLVLAVAAAVAYQRLTQKRPYTGDPAQQRVVILGASSGIGKHLALQYAARGAQLLLVARRRDRLEAVQAECRGQHARTTCEVVVGDAADEAVLAAAAAAARERLGGVDVLVLCAGVTSIIPFEQVCALDAAAAAEPTASAASAAGASASAALVERIFRTNVFSPIMATKHFLPLLRASKGQILVISSAAGIMAAPTRPIYTASKHAMTGFFKTLRIELAASGVSVCIALPGTVDTELRDAAVDGMGATSKYRGSAGISADECARIIIAGADRGDREIYMPWFYGVAHVLSLILPGVVDHFAAKKYKLA
nr:hypothetical protein HK105_008128 [Polyrhizophydium stewartii]